MPMNPTNFSSEDRAFYISIGRKYGSAGVLAQASKTLNALGRHGPALVVYGFSAEDGSYLAEARGMLEIAGVKRESTRVDKRGSGSKLALAQRAARVALRQARTVLEGVDGSNRLNAAAGAEDMNARVRATLDQMAKMGRDNALLAMQLDTLNMTLRDPAIAALAQGRGGAEAVTSLANAATGLRKTSGANTVPNGTPSETEWMHLVDGIVVYLVRRARRAALSASKALSQPALAREFAVTEIYGPRKEGELEEDNPAEGDAAQGGGPVAKPAS